MQSILFDVRPYLEAIYFLCSILLVIIGFYGLRQIRFLKADINGRSERAAKEKAIEASTEYLNCYIPLSNEFTEEILKAKIPFYEGPIGDFSVKSIPKDFIKTAIVRYKLQTWLKSMNNLESVAALFTTGVADEKTGFEIIGRTYCNTVESKYDIISLCRLKDACPYFNNIVLLYKVWAPRLSKVELVSSRKNIEDRIDDIPDNEIPPLDPLSKK
jgi:hypothetical protein